MTHMSVRIEFDETGMGPKIAIRPGWKPAATHQRILDQQ